MFPEPNSGISTKMILVHHKSEIILGSLSNCSFHQYFDCNIGLLSIATCKVIAHRVFAPFLVSVVCFFSWLPILYISLFLAFKGDSGKNFVTFYYRLLEQERATAIALAMVGRAIIIWRAIQIRNHEPM